MFRRLYRVVVTATGRSLLIAFYVFLGFCLVIVFGNTATYDR